MSKPTKAKAYNDASVALERSRRAVETLIAGTDPNDYYTFGHLGPILAELRTAQSVIEELSRHQRYNTNGGKF